MVDIYHWNNLQWNPSKVDTIGTFYSGTGTPLWWIPLEQLTVEPLYGGYHWDIFKWNPSKVDTIGTLLSVPNICRGGCP